MHILLLHQAYAGLNQYGGTRHAELGNYLIEKGHQFTVIGSKINYLTGEKTTQEELVPERFRFLGADTYFGLHKSYFLRALNFMSFMASSFLIGLRIEHVDLIWGTSPPIFQILPAWLLAKIKRIPLVFEVRDLWPAFPVDMGVIQNKFIIWMAEKVEVFFYQRADQIVINSPGFKNHLLEKGISAEKIKVVPNGVDTSQFPPQIEGDDFRKDFDLEDSLVVLYAGAHGLANDLETVLLAAEHVKNAPEIVFVLVGDGKSKAELKLFADKRALKNVRFIPAQPKTAMPRVLAAADICLAVLKDIPMFKTTYPNKVFDYMAAGKPTLLMIDGVIREVVENAGGGIFVTPGDPVALADAVKLLANQPQRRKEMGLSARSYLQDNFRRSDQADTMENLFRELLPRD